MDTPSADRGEGRQPPAAAWAIFEEEVLGAPWGSIAKSELEFKVFRLLMATGSLDATAGAGQIAARLKVPVSRVRTLRYRLDQESIGDDYLAAVIKSFEVHRTEPSTDVHLAIDSRYLRERFVERLRAERIAVRRELAGELLRLELTDLVSFVLMADDVPPADRQALIGDLVPAWREREGSAWETSVRSASAVLSAASDAQGLAKGLLAVLDKAF